MVIFEKRAQKIFFSETNCQIKTNLDLKDAENQDNQENVHFVGCFFHERYFLCKKKTNSFVKNKQKRNRDKSKLKLLK